MELSLSRILKEKFKRMQRKAKSGKERLGDLRKTNLSAPVIIFLSLTPSARTVLPFPTPERNVCAPEGSVSKHRAGNQNGGHMEQDPTTGSMAEF